MSSDTAAGRPVPRGGRARRMDSIRPFYVMEVLERAFALEQAGHPVIHLEVGEPDFPTPAPVVEAGMRALAQGRTRYVQAMGLPELRAAIAENYPQSCRPQPDRVVVTPGSSGALQLVFGVIIDPGDEVLLADPGYPCNANFVRLYGGEPVLIPVGPDTGYQLTAELIARHWSERSKAVLVGTPSNPTGTLVAPAEMSRISATVADLGGHLVVDEIYHGLTYGEAARSALHDSSDVFVVNSFSKYYGMTGWRIGWLVSPQEFLSDVCKLAQNLFISTSTPAQCAALHAFDIEVIAELERRRELFRERRDFLVPALRELGFGIPVTPQGAFYVYADCSAFSDDSDRFALDILEHTKVGITPGRDFGSYRHRQHVRFSYANTLQNLEQAVERLRSFLPGGPPTGTDDR